MNAERGRSRWRRVLTAAELAAVAGFVVLVFVFTESQSTLSATQLSALRLVLVWYLILGVPALFAHVLWKARVTWPERPRWGLLVMVTFMVLAFTPLEYMPIAYLIPGLWANTNLLIASVVIGTAGPVVLMWVLIHIAVLRRRPEDDYPPRSR